MEILKINNVLFLVGCIIMCQFLCRVDSVSAWEPPIGIPRPDFGIEESYRMYDDPANRNLALTYTQNAEGGYYTHYVDNTHPAATDSGNPYGTASNPRNTIPTPLAEGSVVEVHGGIYDSPTIRGIGTLARPIFLRGAVGLEPTITGDTFPQASYMIFENLYLNNNARFVFRFDSSVGLDGPVDHISVRDSEFEGTGVFAGDDAIFLISQEPTKRAENIVIYNNHIHHYGDYLSTANGDAGGVGVTAGEYTWVVDNHIHHIGGDSVMANDGGSGQTDYVYIGRNTMHHNEENAIDLKQSQHVIISENEMYSLFETVVVVHHDPTLNIWITHNNIYDAPLGIATSKGRSTQGPTTVYITDNIIHNTGNAIRFSNSGDIYIVGNTIYDSGRGVGDPTLGSSDALYMSNNIIANLRGGESDSSCIR